MSTKKQIEKRYRERVALAAVMEDPTPGNARQIRKLARGKGVIAEQLRGMLAPRKPKGKGFLTGRYGLKGKR